MLAEASEALPRLATCNLMVGSLVPLEHRFWTRRRVASRAVCTSTPSSTTKLERCTVGLVVQCNRCGSTVLTVAEDYCLDSFPFDCILALRELSLGMISQVRRSGRDALEAALTCLDSCVQGQASRSFSLSPPLEKRRFRELGMLLSTRDVARPASGRGDAAHRL